MDPFKLVVIGLKRNDELRVFQSKRPKSKVILLMITWKRHFYAKSFTNAFSMITPKGIIDCLNWLKWMKLLDAKLKIGRIILHKSIVRINVCYFRQRDLSWILHAGTKSIVDFQDFDRNELYQSNKQWSSAAISVFEFACDPRWIGSVLLIFIQVF